MSGWTGSPLERWADKLEERSAIEDFLDWASRTGVCTFRFAYSRSDVLDRYHEIDRKALEAARRALLDKARSENAD